MDKMKWHDVLRALLDFGNEDKELLDTVRVTVAHNREAIYLLNEGTGSCHRIPKGWKGTKGMVLNIVERVLTQSEVFPEPEEDVHGN
jgi:hypothetical protein